MGYYMDDSSTAHDDFANVLRYTFEREMLRAGSDRVRTTYAKQTQMMFSCPMGP